VRENRTRQIEDSAIKQPRAGVSCPFYCVEALSPPSIGFAKSLVISRNSSKVLSRKSGCVAIAFALSKTTSAISAADFCGRFGLWRRGSRTPARAGTSIKGMAGSPLSIRMTVRVSPWQRAVATRSLYEVEWRAWHAARGQWRHCQTRGVPVSGSDGEVREWIGAVTDVHDRKMLEAYMQKENRLASLGILAGGIAHDFNNLLGGAAAQAELALADLDGRLHPQEEPRAIRDVALRGSEIVRQLMVYAGQRKWGCRAGRFVADRQGDDRVTQSVRVQTRRGGNGSW
jgi:hypothetical protein